MSRLVATIDLSAAVVGTSDTFETQTPNACSALYFMNNSPCFLKLDLGSNGQPIVQPWHNRVFTLKQVIQNVQWSVIAILTSTSAPSTVMYVEAFPPNEPADASLNGPVFRQSNVGNGSLPVTSSNTLINDGNTAGTVIVEATPSGAAGSQAKLTNDGDFLCGGGLFHISNAGVVTAIPAGALPVTALGAGTLPVGVAVPAANVGSGYPATGLGAGALPAGVTLPVSDLTNGTVNVVNGALASGYIQSRFKFFGSSIIVSGRDIIAGTGSGTFSHNCGVSPYIANLICATVNSTQTMGYDSATSSTIHVNTGAGLAWRGDVTG